MYCALTQFSFLMSNTAGDLLIRSIENFSSNSDNENFSLLSLGDHPNNARKLTIASGKYPLLMKSV